MIDYIRIRKKYKPKEIRTLLIGEAPPPNGKTYFYIPRDMSQARNIENDRSLPATIFNHYFDRRPSTIVEYEDFLLDLKERGIFLMDIIDDPIKIRDNIENEKYLVSQIPNLRNKIKSMGISLEEEHWVFLLARTSYRSIIKREFPDSMTINWIDFRVKRGFTL